MKQFYLVSAIVLFILILVISFAQLGATCTWYLFNTNTAPVMVLLQMSGLGAIMGGLLILFWQATAKKNASEEDDDDETGDNA